MPKNDQTITNTAGRFWCFIISGEDYVVLSHTEKSNTPQVLVPIGRLLSSSVFSLQPRISPSTGGRFYQVKVISCGLSTIGNKKWKTTTVPIGQTAMSSLILQSSCRAKAMVSIVAVVPMQNMKLHLNFLSTLLMARKKLTCSVSLEVEPHSRGQLTKCARRACETCREIPPRKMVRSGIHLMFVQRPPRMEPSPMR